MKHIICYLIFLCAFFPSCKEETFTIRKGVNISHWLSQSNSRGEARTNFFTEKDVQYLASIGFDHLRIPIDEEQMFLENGEKDTEAFQLLHNALGWCQKHHLKTVVDLHILRSHHFNNKVKPLFTEEAAQEKFYECWRQISGELKKYANSQVAYELMNEPVADDPETWNKIVNKCAQTVRELEPKRTLVIGSNLWQGYETVKDLKVPENDPNILISFHYYNPFLLTHYQASWTDVKDYNGPVHYPGALISKEDLKTLPENIATKYQWWSDQVFNIDIIESHFKQVLDVANKYKLNVYCGEYGCINSSPEADRNRWFKDMTTLFEKHNIARACWDYKGGFGVIKNGQPDEGMIKAILQ